jgi:hypothetical protein
MWVRTPILDSPLCGISGQGVVQMNGFSRTTAAPQFGRRDTFLRGTIFTPAPIPCAVRDLTLRGARLLVSPRFPLPRQFRLVVESTGFDTHCALTERSADRVLVIFTKASAPAKNS